MLTFKLPQLPTLGRYLLVAVVLLLLAGLGLFEDAAFAALGELWHPGRPPAAVAVTHLSSHGLPVAISYRLLYAALSLVLLHLLLRGRCTRPATLGYATGLAGSGVLLLLAKHVGLPTALMAHHLLDTLASPLPIMLVYPLAELMRTAPANAHQSLAAGNQQLVLDAKHGPQEVLPVAYGTSGTSTCSAARRPAGVYVSCHPLQHQLPAV